MGIDEVSNVEVYDTTFAGAIFMSNLETKKECFRRKLLGLPHSYASFVKQVKTGMILFLFEYEERKLYGVFEATSDGAINIEFSAFRTSGKTFPAQVRFKHIWSCYPLCEPDFSVVIKENYYTSNKFDFCLSEGQVCNLIQLFSSRKIRLEHPRSLRTGKKSIKQFQSCGSSRIRLIDGRRYVTTDSVENDSNTDRDREKFSAVGYSNLYKLDKNHSDYTNLHTMHADLSGSTEELAHTFPSSSELPLSTSMCLPSYRDSGGNLHIIPPHYSPLYPLGPQHTYSSLSLGLDDSSTSMQETESYPKISEDKHKILPFPGSHSYTTRSESELLEPASARMDICTNWGNYIPLLPSPDHRELTSHNDTGAEDLFKLPIPTLPLSGDGNLRINVLDSLSIRSPNTKGLSNMCDCSFPAQLKNEDACEHLGVRATFLDSSGFPNRYSNVPSYAPENKVGCEGTGGLTECDRSNRNYTLQSDTSNKRPSVFSRLSMSPNASAENDDSNSSYSDISVNELMKILSNRRKCWMRDMMKRSKSYNFEVVSQIGMHKVHTPPEKKLLNRITRTENSFTQSPFLNFKRRSEVRKNLAESQGSREGENSRGSSGKNKRRKLIRPSIGKEISSREGIAKSLNGEGLSLADGQVRHNDKISEEPVRNGKYYSALSQELSRGQFTACSTKEECSEGITGCSKRDHLAQEHSKGQTSMVLTSEGKQSAGMGGAVVANDEGRDFEIKLKSQEPCSEKSVAMKEDKVGGLFTIQSTKEDSSEGVTGCFKIECSSQGLSRGQASAVLGECKDATLSGALVENHEGGDSGTKQSKERNSEETAVMEEDKVGDSSEGIAGCFKIECSSQGHSRGQASTVLGECEDAIISGALVENHEGGDSGTKQSEEHNSEETAVMEADKVGGFFTIQSTEKESFEGITGGFKTECSSLEHSRGQASTVLSRREHKEDAIFSRTLVENDEGGDSDTKQSEGHSSEETVAITTCSTTEESSEGIIGGFKAECLSPGHSMDQISLVQCIEDNETVKTCVVPVDNDDSVEFKIKQQSQGCLGEETVAEEDNIVGLSSSTSDDHIKQGMSREFSNCQESVEDCLANREGHSVESTMDQASFADVIRMEI